MSLKGREGNRAHELKVFGTLLGIPKVCPNYKEPPESRQAAMPTKEKPVLDSQISAVNVRQQGDFCLYTAGPDRGIQRPLAATSLLTSSFWPSQSVTCSGTRCQNHICKGLQEYMGRTLGLYWDRPPSQPGSVGIHQRQGRLKQKQKQGSWFFGVGWKGTEKCKVSETSDSGRLGQSLALRTLNVQVKIDTPPDWLGRLR